MPPALQATRSLGASLKRVSSSAPPPSCGVCLHAHVLLEKPVVNVNPCIPSPCGPNSQCRVVGEQPACSCLPNYIGRSPNCRPECSINAECPGTQACQNERCKDPCPGSCGSFTTCVVVKHAPLCQCVAGYTGDPFTVCTPLPPCKHPPLARSAHMPF